MPRRVVVTGLGLVAPVGVGVKDGWEAVVAGRSGIGPITKFDATGFKSAIAGEVKNFHPEDWVSPKKVSRLDVFIHFALAAAKMAVDQSGLIIDDELARRAGTIVGCGLGGLETMETTFRQMGDRGPGRVSPFFIPKIIANMAPGEISMTYNLKGANISIQTACAAGSHAIGDSFKSIQHGVHDVMVCGGVEATITPTAVAGFTAMRALSRRNDDPTGASRPFDRDRDGFVIGEGSGMVILEELEHARRRGADILAEVVGYGLTSDAYHFTAPHPEGEGAVNCMRMAVDDAGLNPEDVDYINAHGTSTGLNDKVETLAVRRVFGDHAYQLAISSTKSMTGHLLGGAGGVEAVFTVMTLHSGVMPPTINYETPDPDCDLDYVPNQAREGDVRIALSNTYGFGGTNAVLAFKRFTG
ncbi:MAG: beta-ketoacyl-ACP synthase II [Proteobacteria bacterium]|nr:beta-ketoacyl-ACP synthase II [Pseudomonadota bacterium]